MYKGKETRKMADISREGSEGVAWGSHDCGMQLCFFFFFFLKRV